MNLFENMVGTGENADNQNFVFFMPPPWKGQGQH